MPAKKSPLSWAGLVLAAFAVLIAIACGGLYWGFEARFKPASPHFSHAAPKDEADGRLQDLDALRRLVDYDRSFTKESKSAFLDRLDALRSSAPDMTPIRFELEISEAVALANSRQTRVLHEGRLNRLPIRMTRFREGVFVTKATAEYVELLGAQVLAVGGITIENALDRFVSDFAGPEGWRRRQAAALLHSPEALQAQGLSGEFEGAQLDLLLPSGKILNRRLAALPALAETDPLYQDWMDVIPGTLPGPAAENWQSYLPSGGISEAWLADPQEAVATRAIDRPNALYIRLMNAPKSGNERTLLAAALKAAEAKSFHHLILDLRLGLGPAAEIEDFVRDLPKAAPDGGIFVFVGPNTISAATRLLARLKQAAPERVLIIGEAPGDGAQYWDGEGGPFVLPNSHIAIAYATAYHDVEHGCRDFPVCYWPEIVNPVAAGPIALDVNASQRFVDYAAGRDTLAEVIKILIGSPDA